MKPLNLVTAKDVFEALRQISKDCEQRAEGASAADDEDRAEDWRYLTATIDQMLTECSHLEA